MDCQKMLPTIWDMKSTQSKIKPIKTGNEIGATYCFGCRDYTDNFKPQEVKWQIKCLEENQSVLFVDLLNQDFSNKKTATKNNLATT